MTWKLKPQELESVLKLSAKDRVAYAMKKFADQEEIWSLKDQNGWVLTRTPQGVDAVPIWPHAQYAAECTRGVWAGATPEVIQLDEWIEDWLPGIKNDSRLIAVFPSPDANGAVLASDEFARDLQEELDRIE